MPRFELRPTTEADRSYVARLNFLADVMGDERAELPAGAAHMARHYVDGWVPEDGGFIAWDGTVPAGGVWLVWGTDDHHGYGHASADLPELCIAVEPRYQGKGLGGQLLEAARELGLRLGWPGISLAVSVDNPGARRLYERHGFAPVPGAGEEFGVLVLSLGAKDG